MSSIEGLPQRKNIEKSGIIMTQCVLINIKFSFQESCDIKCNLCYWRNLNNHTNYNKVANKITTDKLRDDSLPVTNDKKIIFHLLLKIFKKFESAGSILAYSVFCKSCNVWYFF